ncbi:MAG: YdeI/OmpD-associated family protein, partial [Thermomicrobiales bacterium]|nr:YdeI/OmpD-associated family protein [Thermomicrobiales bacterium]
WPGMKNKGAWFIGTVTVGGLGIAAIGTSQWYPLTAGIMLLWGMGGGFFINLNQTLIQTNTPSALMGRVMSVHTLGFLGFAPLGALLAGGMAALLGAPLWMLISGLTLSAIALSVGATQPGLRRMGWSAPGSLWHSRTMEQPPDSVHPGTRREWRDWLAANHTRSQGIWLISYRKSAGLPSMTHEESVEEALCFGWVDSRPRKLDAERTMLWFAPRKPGSGWARTNKQRVERLLAAGSMAPAGLAAVESAKADGSWTKLDAVEDLVVPPDLAAALAEHPPAVANFDAFPKSARRGILEWLVQAKTAPTRAKRVEETARLAQRNERANQWKPKP